MKLSFSTVMCMDLKAEQIADMCVRHGLDGIEIRLDGKATDFNGEILKSRNIAVPIVGTSVCLKGYSPEAVAEAGERIDLASSLGAMGIRLFLGNFAARRDAEISPLDCGGIVTALREICDIGERKGVTVCVETHNEYATGKALFELKKAVARDNLKFIWDIIHPIEDGETPAETWQYIGSDIAHVHIKDGRDRQDPMWHDFLYTPLGDGTLPIADVIEILKENAYDGFLSLEWEEAWREELRALNMDCDSVLDSFKSLMKLMG